MAKSPNQFTAATYQFDCDNCMNEMLCNRFMCALVDFLPPVSDDELRVINTVRLLESKPAVGLGQLGEVHG